MPLMNLQDLQQENDMLSMVKITQTMVKGMKIVQPLNLKTKSLNQVFVIISDVYILVTGNITATGGDVNTRVAFKNCAPFSKCITHINDEHVDNADNFDIIMPMYNLSEYSYNYLDTSGSIWQFKRDEQNMNNGNPANFTTDDSSFFKCKSSFFKLLTATDNGVFKDLKIAVPLKYLSIFWRSLKMPLINCKINLELNWTKNCIMSNIADTTFKITNTKLYVPIVTLSSKDIVKLVKLLEEGFKRLFVLDLYNTDNGAKKIERNSRTKYFFPRVNITNYNVLINGRKFYDQPINDLGKQYDKIRKTATGQ